MRSFVGDRLHLGCAALIALAITSLLPVLHRSANQQQDSPQTNNENLLALECEMQVLPFDETRSDVVAAVLTDGNPQPHGTPSGLREFVAPLVRVIHSTAAGKDCPPRGGTKSTIGLLVRLDKRNDGDLLSAIERGSRLTVLGWRLRATDHTYCPRGGPSSSQASERPTSAGR